MKIAKAKTDKRRASRHDVLVALAKAAIDDVFSDTTVPQATTVESLEELIEDCRFKIAAIKGDRHGK